MIPCRGGSGDDTVRGRAGDDDFLLGSGDAATGGPGIDFSGVGDRNASGPSEITDFDDAEDVLLVGYSAPEAEGTLEETSGVTVALLDWVPVTILQGVTGLDPASVVFRPYGAAARPRPGSPIFPQRAGPASVDARPHQTRSDAASSLISSTATGLVVVR